MNTQLDPSTDCKICGKPASRSVGERGRISLCNVCANRIGRSDLYSVIPTFKVTAPPTTFGNSKFRSSALSTRSRYTSAYPASFRAGLRSVSYRSTRLATDRGHGMPPRCHNTAQSRVLDPFESYVLSLSSKRN